MEFPARNADMLHNKTRKSKGEKPCCFQDLDARNDASKCELAGRISSSKNKTGLQNFHD
jgi:hypothetical protein